MVSLVNTLPSPANYFPFESGTYDVLPGLKPFGEDFGNGVTDQCVFQIDAQFLRYRSAKLAARREDLGRHVLHGRFSDEAAAEVVRFVVMRLVAEHPQWFTLRQGAAIWELTCQLTREVLGFDQQWRLEDDATRSDVSPRYTSALDALACQVQEDMAVTCTDESENWIAALHVCLPSHWSPAEKLGRDFAAVHAVVPGMEPFFEHQERLVHKMLGATSGLVRFVWGLQWNETLNRHPARCSAVEKFDPQAQNAFLRVERQTIWGFPQSQASLFTIRPYLIPVFKLARQTRLVTALAAAVASMSRDSLQYKGLTDHHEAFLSWLQQMLH